MKPGQRFVLICRMDSCMFSLHWRDGGKLKSQTTKMAFILYWSCSWSRMSCLGSKTWFGTIESCDGGNLWWFDWGYYSEFSFVTLEVQLPEYGISIICIGQPEAMIWNLQIIEKWSIILLKYRRDLWVEWYRNRIRMRIQRLEAWSMSRLLGISGALLVKADDGLFNWIAFFMRWEYENEI